MVRATLNAGPATEAQVRAIPMNAVATSTFTPISHNRALDFLMDGLDNAGLKVTGAPTFTVANEGHRVFGAFQLSTLISDGVALMIGFTNSTDKSLAMKIGFGSSVFVCSNGCFFAERIIGRKHTTNIERDIPGLMADALAQTESFRTQQADFFDALRQRELTPAQANDLTVRLARDYKAITKGEILDVVDEFLDPSHDEFDRRDFWGYHNAVTEVGKRIGNKNGIAHSERMISLTGALQHELALLN